MDMPYERFMMFHRNVDRLQAEDDVRHLMIAFWAQDGKHAQDHVDKLMDRIGTVVEFGHDASLIAAAPSPGAKPAGLTFEDLKARAQADREANRHLLEALRTDSQRKFGDKTRTVVDGR